MVLSHYYSFPQNTQNLHNRLSNLHLFYLCKYCIGVIITLYGVKLDFCFCIMCENTHGVKFNTAGALGDNFGHLIGVLLSNWYGDQSVLRLHSVAFHGNHPNSKVKVWFQIRSFLGQFNLIFPFKSASFIPV